MSAPDPTAPTSVAHFRILGRLGQGGMGVVYRAEDDILRRTVALKLLPLAVAGNEERRQRLLREARAGAVSHPNVAVIHQVGEADGRVFIAMELIEGESLRERLRRGPMDSATVRALGLQIARGLAAAHDKGTVHRDLKPENVMIAPGDVVKILDFGLAKASSADSQAGSSPDAALAETETQITVEQGRVMGTPEYMSPEQALGLPVDVRSDVFSLGTVLFEMLSGGRPFTRTTTGQVLVAVARDPAPPLRVAGVEPALEAVVRRCLEKDPAARYPSGREVAEALEPVAAPRPVPRAPRGRAAAGIAAIGLLAGLAGLLAFRGLPSRATPGAGTGAASASASAPRGGVAITGHPPPRTSSPEAAAAYAEALQALRDASVNVAYLALDRAVRLDPRLAAAHVRLLYVREDRTAVQRHMVAAAAARADLEPRDLALLEAREPYVHEPIDLPGMAARAARLAQDYPDDAEVLTWAAYGAMAAGREEQGRAALSAALRADPRYALAEHAGAVQSLRQGRLEDALAAADRCLAIAPTAASCLRRRGDVHAALGQCRALEADAREMIAVEPAGPLAYGYLGVALQAQGAPLEALKALEDRAIALVPDPERASLYAMGSAARLAVYVGDFAAAEASLVAMDRRAASALNEGERRVHDLLAVYEEEGAPAKALAAADEYARGLPAWAQDPTSHARPLVLAVRHRGGHLPDADFASLREAWLAQAQTLEPAALAGDAWTDFFAYPATLPAEAAEALAALPRFTLPSHRARPDADGAMGRVRLLAGDAAGAVPLLRAATAWCGAVPANGLDPVGVLPAVRRIQNHYFLGRALEQVGDRGGACAAYGLVVDRWSHARPRSITLEKARDRAQALGCAR